MSLPGILGGFETLQKQFFNIFGAKEKTGKISDFFDFSVKNQRFFPIFCRFFFPIFFVKIISMPLKNRFFANKLVKKSDFLFIGYHFFKPLRDYSFK